MAIIGINVERKSCRKTYTTMTTSRKASISVLITSSIDAKRKSFALDQHVFLDTREASVIFDALEVFLDVRG